MKKIITLCFLMALVGVKGWGQVNITATLGSTSGTAATVNAAFTAINAGTYKGVITLTVVSSTTEPSTPIPLLASGSAGGSSYTSLTIKPSGNVIIGSAAAVANRGIIELAGADNVTIDGDDPVTAGSQNLSIVATQVSNAGIACVRLSSNSTTGTDGANNNVVKNCIITGARQSATSTVVSYGIEFSNGTSTSVSTTGAYSSLNTVIQNNIITRCYYGIHAIGSSTTYPNTGTQILNNIIGSSTALNNVGLYGVNVTYSATSTTGSVIIAGNDIQCGDYTTGFSANPAGVSLGASNYAAVVRNNNIHDVANSSSSGWGAYGLYISSSTSNTGIKIYNNFIRDITANNYSIGLTTAYQNWGIYTVADITGLQINHNTIYLNKANATTYGTSNPASACINIYYSSSATAVISQLLNNILVNNQSSSAAYGIITYSTTQLSSANVNNNDYYVPSGQVGYYNAANRTTLSAWQAATGKDAASQNVLPTFTSTTDLHIPAGTQTTLESGGASTAITGIATDIDGQTRPGPTGSANGGATAPDIGADEFDGVPAAACLTPTAQPTSLTFPTVLATSVSGSFTAASTVPSGYVVFRSTVNTPPAPVDGTTYAAGSTPTFNSITYNVISNGTSTTFTDATVTASQTYYYFVYSYNSGTCTGGPKYLTTSPLTNSVLTCTAAPTLSGTATGTTTATITYSVVSGATSYVLQYKQSSSSTWITVSPAATSSGTYALTGLTASTTYDLQIIEPNANCGTLKTVTGAFTTTCAPTALPYVQGFNSSTIPTCWSQSGSPAFTFPATGTGTPAPTPYEGTNQVMFNSYSYSTTNLLASAPLSSSGVSSVDVQFEWYHSTNGGASSYTTEGVTVQYSTDGTNWTSVGSQILRYNATAGWSLKTVTLPAAAANQPLLYVGFLFKGNSGYDCYMDAVDIHATPSCIPPTNLTSSAITSSSATLTWTASTSLPSSYDIYYSTSNTAPTATTPATTTSSSNTITLSGLSSATTYYAWVRSACGGSSGSSTWLGYTTFTTSCSAVTFFSENFDGVTAPALPTCWKDVANTGYAYTYSSTYYSAPNSLYITYNGTTKTVVSMPPVSNAGTGTNQLRFKERANVSTGQTLEVGYLTNPTDASSFVSVTSYVTSSTTVWTEHTVNMGTTPGSNQYLAFRVGGVSFTSMLVDDVYWEAIPSCVAPTGLTASSITTTSATVSWTAPSTGTPAGYNWEVRSSGAGGSGSTGLASSGSTAATTTSASVSGLSASTSYTLYVQTSCGGSSTSTWAGPYAFTTSCGPASLPYTQNFDGVTAPAIPTCTLVQDANGDGTTWATYATGASSSPNALHYLYNTSNAADDWWFTPGFNLTAGTAYQVVFKYKIASTSFPESLELKIGNSQSAVGMGATPLWSVTNDITSISYQTITVNFTATAGLQYFGWHVNSAADEDGVYLDDITIQVQPACTGSNGGTATASSSSICGGSGSTTLLSTGYSTGTTATYQWQYSSDNFASDIHDLSGQTNPASASTGTISATTYYRLKVTCTATNPVTTGYSNTVIVTVNNPLVTSTTPGSTCGTGTVALAATPSTGATINWYAASSGGSVLATGNTFTTPSISTTTTYYAEATSGGNTTTTGPANYLYGGTVGTVASPSNSYYMIFNATSTVKMNSVTVYATAAGSLNLQLATTAGTILQTYSYTITTAQANSTLTTLGTAIVVPVNFDVPVGTSLRLGIASGTTATLLRNTSGATAYYGVVSNGVMFTGNWFGDNTYWYFFYNISLQTGCSSGRTPVIATVTTPPATQTLSTNQTSSCATNPTAYLSLSGSETDVSYQVYNGSTPVGSAVQGTGAALTDFYGVTATGTYKVIGTRTVNGINCASTMSGTPTVTVTTINIYNVMGSGTTCGNGTITLSNSQSGITYRLTGPAATQSKTGTGGVLTFTVTVSGTYAINATTSGGCYEDMNGNPTVTINPIPVITGAPFTATICSGSTFTVTPTSSVSGTTYTWTTPTYTGSVSGGSAQPTGQPTVSGTLSNAGINSDTATYTVTPATSTCTGSSFKVTVAVAATLANTSISATSPICSGGGTTVIFSGAANSTVYYTANGGSQQNVVLNASGNYSLTIPSLTTTTTYTLVSAISGSNSSCTQTLSNSATVTVTDYPIVPAIAGPKYIALSKSGNYTNTTTGGTWSIISDPSGTGSTIPSQSTNPAKATVKAGNTNVGVIILAYSVSNATGCSTTVTDTIQIFDNAITRYRTKQDGYATDNNTWSVLDSNNVWKDANASPTNADNIEVRHNLSLLYADYDGVAGSSFAITNYDTVINGTNTTVNGTLTVAPTHYFQSQGSVNFNGRLVVLKSSSEGTAAIGTMKTDITGASNVRVERFTDGKSSSTATGSRRAWRLVTSPVMGQSIHEAWQENAISNRNPNPGYGTIISGYNMPDSATAAAQGYDFTGAGLTSSIRRYDIATNAWVSLPTTGSTRGTFASLQSEPAFMLFIRGDRSVFATGTTVDTLRSMGTLQQGLRNLSFTSGKTYVLVGNPYASAIDFGHFYSNSLSNNGSLILDQFYSWNSTIGTYGAYVLVTHTGTGANAGGYEATPDTITGINTQNRDKYKYIPSGSGFFVTAKTTATAGTINFREDDKAPGKVPPINPFRVVPNPTNVKQIIVNLNLKDGDTSVTLADGFRANFSADYEGNEEDNSSTKLYNFNENLNLARGSYAHIIEAHGDVKQTDTLYMKLWNVTKRSYQLQVIGENWTSAPNVHAYLVDNYLATKQEVTLSGTVTSVNFTVNTDSASWQSDRFSIVFQNSAAVLPVTLTSVKAAAQNGGVNVSWTVTSEQNIKTYTVERSINDGTSYTAIGSQQAKNQTAAAMTNYQSFDAAPQTGSNLYRIRIETKEGVVTYSSVVTVVIGQDNGKILITLYPNPVRPNGKVSLQLSNLQTGTYLVNVYSQAGQTIYQKKITISQANTTQSEELRLGSTLAQGSYEVRLSSHTGTIFFTDQLVIGR